jgi:hypothetical protein
MNEHVNLLNNTGGRNYANIITKLRVLRIIAVGGLFFVGAASIMLFLIIAFSPLPNLRQDEERYITTLTTGENREKMDKYYFINSRLRDIEMLLSKRPDLIASYDLVESSFTPATTVNFLDITDTAISMNVSSSNLIDLEFAVDKLNQQAKNTKRITSMTLSSISYDAKRGTYEMVVTISQV